jgi:hypothetical protein
MTSSISSKTILPQKELEVEVKNILKDILAKNGSDSLIDLVYHVLQDINDCLCSDHRIIRLDLKLKEALEVSKKKKVRNILDLSNQ